MSIIKIDFYHRGVPPYYYMLPLEPPDHQSCLCTITNCLRTIEVASVPSESAPDHQSYPQTIRVASEPSSVASRPSELPPDHHRLRPDHHRLPPDHQSCLRTITGCLRTIRVAYRPSPVAYGPSELPPDHHKLPPDHVRKIFSRRRTAACATCSCSLQKTFEET